MKFKQRTIIILNPIRRLAYRIYSFFIAAYLGKIVVLLNQIDHNILDMMFYFFVYDPMGEDIKEYYRVVSSQTMGKKLRWLEEVYKGNVEVINKEKKTTLKVAKSVLFIVGNNKTKEMIDLLKQLINDTRNPLIHSNYYLGWGNTHEWRFTYIRTHFNKRTNDFESESFTFKEAQSYLKNIKEADEKLKKLYGRLLHESFQPK